MPEESLAAKFKSKFLFR